MVTTTRDQPRAGLGPGGRCLCLKCGRTLRHEAGVRCLETKCPACGATMVREGSAHHRRFLEKSAAKSCR